MPVDLELWNKLNDFQLDDKRAAVCFTDRLAQENGWTKAFARRAVEEYKKFVYLAATGAAPVTPSDVVDQVWHLHLTFTRSYWDDMCAGILGRTLHHGPTKGGKSEDAKYRTQYAETLTHYREEFGTEPPAEFWPPADARFSSAPHQRWIDARTHFVIRKPSLRALWSGAAIAATGSFTATAAAATSTNAGGTATTAIIIGSVAAAALLLLGLFSGGGRQTHRRGKAGQSRDDGSSTFIPFIGSPIDGKHGGEGGEGGGEGGGGEGGGGDGGGSGCGGGGGCGSS